MPTKALEPNTQEERVLQVLEYALEGKIKSEWINDGWVNKRYFVREMGLTQAGRAFWNLENKMGIVIERGEKDAFGFLSYRLVPSNKLF